MRRPPRGLRDVGVEHAAHDDDSRARTLPRNLAADVQSIDVRKIDVHHDHDRLKIVCGLGDLPSPTVPTTSHSNEQAAERLHDAEMIVREQDAWASRHHGFVRSPAPRAACMIRR
jgi:hypothetical protein